jgi:hypothetical protein
MTADGKDLHRMQVATATSLRIGGTNPSRASGRTGDTTPSCCSRTWDDVLRSTTTSSASPACRSGDWLIKTFGAYPDTFVPTAVLPMRNVAQTLDEFRRAVALGYRSVMLPTLPPLGLRYNNKDFDPIWAYAQEQKIPLAFHVASGLTPISERGPGAAIINYMRLGFATEELVTYLVAGGALDRHPGLTVVVIEAGASWMAGLGERLEVHTAHQYYVKLLPQAEARSYSQGDVPVRPGVPPDHRPRCLLWASDCPHGRHLPNSRSTSTACSAMRGLRRRCERAALGGTAARMCNDGACLGDEARRLNRRPR